MKLTALIFSLFGLAMAACAPGPNDDYSSSEDGLSAVAQGFVGAFTWQSSDAFGEFESLALRTNGTYEAKWADPAIRCVRFPCTRTESGRWSAYKRLEAIKISLRPDGGSARIYTATKESRTLTMTRLGGTSILRDTSIATDVCARVRCGVGTHCVDQGGRAQCVANGPSCAAMLCITGTTCVEENGVGKCVAPACQVTGCSSQLCADRQFMTTCDWRPEYACFRTAECARQTDGRCGWTATPALRACVQNPPNN